MNSTMGLHDLIADTEDQVSCRVCHGVAVCCSVLHCVADQANQFHEGVMPRVNESCRV